MQRIVRTTAVIGALAALAFGASACSTTASADAESGDAAKVQTLLVATGASPKPFTYLDDDNTLTGYDIEVLRAIDEKLPDIAFDFETAEFPALFAGLDSGRFNIVANNLSVTEERKEKYDFSDANIQAQFGITVKDGSGLENVTTLDELAGKKTYGEAGLNFTRILESYNEAHPDKTIQIEYSEADLQTQHKNLATGAVDFILEDKVVSKGYGTDQDLPVTFVPFDGDYLVKDFGTNLLSAYAFSKQTPNLDTVLPEINGALKELNEDGTLTKLSEQFFDGIDVSPKL